jgi:hypothetical protein
MDTRKEVDDGQAIHVSTAARLNVAGLVAAAAGILIQYFSGVEGFPTVPPGPFGRRDGRR